MNKAHTVRPSGRVWGGVERKDNVVTRLNIRVRYHNGVLSFHLTKLIPMRSKLFAIDEWALEYL